MLLSEEQIRCNLRRTTSAGLISLLNGTQLTRLALKYFGVYENNNFIGYQCPYSGKLITNFNELILEHIIPVSSNGGTVLFNCIPASIEVNGSNEKGAKHLLDWWLNSKYWDEQAVERFVKLTDYIFEAYDLVFTSHSIDEAENFDFDNFEESNDSYISQLSNSQKEEHQLLTNQAKETGFITYLQFLNDCIAELKKLNLDTTKYEEKLKSLSDNGIFVEINKYTTYQNILKQIIKEKLNQNGRSELTFVLNMNIQKIINSMLEYNEENKIYNELLRRINNLQKILLEHNIGLLSYLEDIRNLRDIDILSIPLEQITEKHIEVLINKINLCVADNFNKVLHWYSTNKTGNLSRGISVSEEENNLRNFIEKFYAVDTKGTTFFHTRLNAEQLKILCNSDDIRLQSIYIKILQKSIIYNISLDYDNADLRLKLEEIFRTNGEFSNNFIDDLSIDEQQRIYNAHPEIEKSKFISLIEWFENPNNYRKNPENGSLENDFVHSLISVFKTKNNYSFNINLSKQQIAYLHDSPDIRLQSIYIKLLQKSIIYNIPLKFDDLKLKTIFEEIYKKNGTFSNNFIDDLNIEEQKGIYNAHPEIEKSKFISLIEWFENKDNYGKKQPTKGKDYDLYGNSLIGYYNKLFQVSKSKNGYVFNINLSTEQMNYLKNSNDIRLKMIYVERIKKAIEYNIQQNNIDSKSIEEIIQTNSINNNFILGLPIEEQIIIYNAHPEIKKSKFILLLEWYADQDNISKFYPQKTKSVSKSEKDMRTFYETLITPYFGKKGNSFDCNLSEEQLKYLCNSDDIRLQSIYIKILQKSIMHDIPIRYVNEDLKTKMLKVYESTNEFSDNFIDDLEIEEQIDIYENNSNLEKSLFISLIEWYKNPENTNKLNPKQRIDLTDSGKDLGSYIQQIKGVRKYKDGYYFGKKLSYIQLKYLYESSDDRMNKLYNEILENAINAGIQIAYYPDNFMKRGVQK